VTDAAAIVVPTVVGNKARALGADAWLTALPEVVAELGREWSFTVGPAVPDATEAFVAPVTLAGGAAAVLKVLVPRHAAAADREAIVLRLVDGDGCPRLLRHDERRGALLLERLGRPLHQLGLPLGRRLDVLADAARRVWRPAPGCGLPTGAEKGRWLTGFVTERWERLDRPCAERTIEHALACASRRVAAHDDERAVLVHGDVHQWNACETATGFALVDPDGLLAEPEYDLGVLLREDPVELLRGDPTDRARRLAQRSGLDATAIWEWGVVERVATGLLCTEVDLQPVGRQMLATADVVATPG
jgi:streptomycin 6-kinase